jgi:hypothetical protein
MLAQDVDGGLRPDKPKRIYSHKQANKP